MNALYFPFTFLSQGARDALMTCFDTLTVLLPSALAIPESMARWRDEGRLELHTPVSGDEAVLARMRDAHRAWAETHRGSEAGWWRHQEGAVPMYDENAVTRIRSEIARGGPAATSSEPLMAARFFLQMAQEFDAQNAAIEQDLSRFQNMQAQMLSALTGDAATDADGIADPASADPVSREFMVDQRLTAWAQLFAAGPPQSVDLLATTSVPAAETLLDILPQAVPLCRIPLETGPGDRFRRALDAYLAALFDDPSAEPPPMPDTVEADRLMLGLWRIPDATMDRVVDAVLGRDPGGTPGPAPAGPVLAVVAAAEFLTY